MSLFFRVYEHLLPKARAFHTFSGKRLTQLFEGLVSLPEDARKYFDDVYLDVFPQTTRELDAWEEQFGLPDTGLTEQQRRDRVEAAWKALGGQDPRYIQDTLQAAGFDVYVHEWWDPDNIFHPGYEMCAGATNAVAGNPNAIAGAGETPDVIRSPVARAPRTYLSDALTEQGFNISAGAASAVARAKVLDTEGGIVADGVNAVSGNDNAVAGLSSYTYPSVAGSRISPAGYPLVNILTEATDGVIGAGQLQAVAGGMFAIAGASQRGETRRDYPIPDGAQYWPYFLYIGGENFPEVATVPANRKLEFETLCLSICPTQQWLGILVTYT